LRNGSSTLFVCTGWQK